MTPLQTLRESPSLFAIDTDTDNHHHYRRARCDNDNDNDDASALPLKGLAVPDHEMIRSASSTSTSTTAPTMDYLNSSYSSTPQTTPPGSLCVDSEDCQTGLSSTCTSVEDMTKLRPSTALDRRPSNILELPPAFQSKQTVRNSQSLSQLRERSKLLLRKTSSWAPNGAAALSPSRSRERVSSSYSNRQATPVSRGSVRPTILDKLSVDLWQRVIDEGKLSPADGAALALSSKTMYDKLSARTFPVLKRTSSRTEKLKFLKYFHRYYPEDILCPQCLTFHNVNSTRFMDNECIKRRSPKAVIFDNHELSWWQVQQLVNASSNQKLYPLLANSFEWNSRHAGGFDSRSEVRVVDGRVLFKVESRIQLRNIGRSSEAAKPATCPHICGGTIEGHLEKVKCWWMGKKKNLMDNNTVLRCERCPTEYSLAIEKKKRVLSFLRGSDILVLTRWFDAGDGMGVASDEWFNLTYSQCDFTETENPRPRSPTKTMRNTARKPFDLGILGAVRSRFEKEKQALTVKSIMH